MSCSASLFGTWKNLPFSGFEIKQAKSHRTFLILNWNASNKRNSRSSWRVKDIFVFCCYTSLAHLYVEKLTPDNIVAGIGGKNGFIHPGKKLIINLTSPSSPAVFILEKYRHHPLCINTNRLLPVITNIKTNAYLKEITQVCGMKKNLTFHIARYTFATNPYCSYTGGEASKYGDLFFWG